MIELFIKSNMENIKYLVLSLINFAFIQKFLQFLNWEKKIVLILNFLILELITMEIHTIKSDRIINTFLKIRRSHS